MASHSRHQLQACDPYWHFIGGVCFGWPPSSTSFSNKVIENFRLRYGLSKVYPTFIKSGQSFPPPAQLRLWCFLEPFLSRLGDPERSRCRRRRPPRWLRSRSAGGADIAAGLTAAAGTDPPWLIKFENLFFLICFFYFSRLKKETPKLQKQKILPENLQ